MKIPISIIFITIFLFAACSEQKKSAVDELKEKVMAVHDEVMPKMGDIMKYKKQLNKRIDELLDAGAEENAEKIAELKNAVENLDNSRFNETTKKFNLPGFGLFDTHSYLFDGDILAAFQIY